MAGRAYVASFMWIKAFILSPLILFPAYGATYNSNGSASDVQSKINSASSGDTVTIPAGTFTWSTTVTIPATKGITLQGAGETQTTIIRGVSGPVQTLSVACGPTTPGVRVTAIKWVDNHTSEIPGHAGHIGMSGGPTTAKFRIDHCTFDNSSTEGLKHAIQVYSSQFGVIDHCTFRSGTNSEHIHNHGRTPPYSKDGVPDWTNDVFPGSDQALYIEDCTFINTSTPKDLFWGNAAMQNYNGARVVFRHNKLQMSHVDVHGTAGMVGGRWFEIYNNHFTILGGQSDVCAIRGRNRCNF